MTGYPSYPIRSLSQAVTGHGDVSVSNAAIKDILMLHRLAGRASEDAIVGSGLEGIMCVDEEYLDGTVGNVAVQMFPPLVAKVTMTTTSSSSPSPEDEENDEDRVGSISPKSGTSNGASEVANRPLLTIMTLPYYTGHDRSNHGSKPLRDRRIP